MYLVPTLAVLGALVAWAASRGAVRRRRRSRDAGRADHPVRRQHPGRGLADVGRRRGRRAGRSPGASPWPASVVLLLVVGVSAPARGQHDHGHRGVPRRDLRRGRADARPGPPIETPGPEFTEPPEETAHAAPALAAVRVAGEPTPSPTPVIPPYPEDGGDGTLPEFGAAVPWKRADPEQPWGDDGRFDLLLIGSDAGSGPLEPPQRRHAARRGGRRDRQGRDDRPARATCRTRRTRRAPPATRRACGCQPGLINEMYVEATVRHPGLWPGKGAVKGIGAVRSVVSTLTGRPIDAVLIVDLVGVIRVVDAMGGVDIDVPEAVVDDRYPDPGRGKIQLRIKAGKQHFDGHEALAYARSRHMDSDYGRMERQQILLLAIRKQLGPSVDPQRTSPVRGRQGDGLDRPPARGAAQARGAVRQDGGREGQAAADRARPAIRRGSPPPG